MTHALVRTRWNWLGGKRLPGVWMALLICLITPGVEAADAKSDPGTWKVGLASTKVTPSKPIPMSGYATRVKPFTRVEQDLYAKAMSLEDQQGRRLLIVTMDLIGLSADLAENVAGRLSEKTGIERGAILLSYAHNHAGPTLKMEAKPNFGVSAEDARNIMEYTGWLLDRLVDLGVEATNSSKKQAKLSWGTGVVNFVMNRREFTATKGVVLGVNPRGLADRTVPVLRVEDADGGKPLAVLFGCAVHCTTLGGSNYVLFGEYAGFAQHYIQEQLPGTQAMFIMGMGGDANPYPKGTIEIARQHGEELGSEVCRVLKEKAKLKPVPAKVKVAYDHADIPLRTPPSVEELKKVQGTGSSWQPHNAKTMLDMIERGETPPKSYRAPIAVWQFGTDDLTLVALSGEVVVDYVKLIEAAIGPLNLWPAAYCNDYFGYLPSARVLEEGGYETRGLHSGRGQFSPEAEKVVVAKVKELAEKVGRKTPGQER